MIIRNILSHIKRKAVRVIRKLQGKQFAHFLHIGKTGGSAVKYALRNNNITDKFVIYLHGHEVTLRDIPKGDKVFFCLRNPVDRFVSAFYSRKRKGQPRINAPWSREEEIAFGNFETPNQLAIAIYSDDKDQSAKALQAMQSIGHIRESFWKWFDNEDYLLSRRSDILLIGFQESLSADFKILKSRLSLPDEVKLPDDEIQSHKNPENVDKTLEDIAITNLRKWYQDDYRLIELCKAMTTGKD